MHAEACIEHFIRQLTGYLTAQRPTANYRMCEEVKRRNKLPAAIVKTTTT